MADILTLQTRLEALRASRASGLRSITYDGMEKVFRNDVEMAAAIADLERQIFGASGRRVSEIRFFSSKGL